MTDQRRNEHIDLQFQALARDIENHAKRETERSNRRFGQHARYTAKRFELIRRECVGTAKRFELIRREFAESEKTIPLRYINFEYLNES